MPIFVTVRVYVSQFVTIRVYVSNFYNKGISTLNDKVEVISYPFPFILCETLYRFKISKVVKKGQPSPSLGVYVSALSSKGAADLRYPLIRG